ncbi:hypothetical protein M9H77_01175 [Catharanthus roseus]|uniref:Uncharacterized protein n=1 Tax=Catharanthus roseus TaxID=4058 RepID=A0ACC0C5A1_CATRO|nr:hypothetical protein M9H77_01175 [Catharanthus roseus]
MERMGIETKTFRWFARRITNCSVLKNPCSIGALQEGSPAENNSNVETMSTKLNDVDIQKVLSAVINGTNMDIVKETFFSGPNLASSTKPRGESSTTSAAGTEHLKIDIVDEGDEEVLELEFERAVEKMHTHEYNMYCPNCSNRITKVVLRRRKKRTQSQDLLGCLSCFSIFIPKGNILNPFKIFGSWGEPAGSSQSHHTQQPVQAEAGSTVQQQPAPGVSIDDKGTDPSSTSGKGTVGENASNSKQTSTPAHEPNQLPKPNDNATVPGFSSNKNEALDWSNVAGGKASAGTSSGVSNADSSIFNGHVILDIPYTPEGTTPGIKSPLKPIGEIEEGLNTNGQYPGGAVQFPPAEEGPVPADPSQLTGYLTDATTPLIAKQEQSSKSLEILKSIVYGGLTESITSLSIVSSAAASEATTLNIVALGLANLVGGLVVLFHSLKELRYEVSNEAANGEPKGRYHELLGRRENFVIHTIFAVLSYIVFGLIPPVVYGFTFRETDDRDYKLLAVAAASLTYTRGQHYFTEYTKTVLYYVTGAIAASGIAYAAGHLAERFMDKLGWFDSNPAKHFLIPENNIWASF